MRKILMNLSLAMAFVAIFITSCSTKPIRRDFYRTPADYGVNDPYRIDGVGTYYDADKSLTPSERVGREIWYKAANGNDRFHQYTFPQRVIYGGAVDWYKVLGVLPNMRKGSDVRFDNFGLIPDPSCCDPDGRDPKWSCDKYKGTAVYDMIPKSSAATYGFLWCPGDEDLLPKVGQEGYRDPACDLADYQKTEGIESVGNVTKNDPCKLHFGTSAGAQGFRKFPNPRFNPKQWADIGGWSGYSRWSPDGENKNDRLDDHSIEPPFRIGISCGSCHIAYDPTNPPADPNNPTWKNIKGAVGNQFIRVSEILGSGVKGHRLQWQLFAHAKPGTVDTSAVPNDAVNNPGTMNAILNFNRRPGLAPSESVSDDGKKFNTVGFNETMVKWYRGTQCPNPEIPALETYKDPSNDQAWVRCRNTEVVPHILKGGGDSIGALEAVQRVYINIGLCSEQCWLNHLTDLRALDPRHRNYGQTPFDIGQCRRDCKEFRSLEDHLGDIANFLVSQGPFDLKDAFVNQAQGAKKIKLQNSRDALEEEVARSLQAANNRLTGKESTGYKFFDEKRNRILVDFDNGRELFKAKCARCHSSLNPAKTGRNYEERARTADRALDPIARLDWLGNDQITQVTQVRTYSCRSLHSNHMQGHIWEQYASETYQGRASVDLSYGNATGGRGYYRNISLLSLWAFAPFMHNNGIGPEVCGRPGEDPYYNDPYSGSAQRACWKFPVSVEERLSVYIKSMDMLFNSNRRDRKITSTDEQIRIPLGPSVWGEEFAKLSRVAGGLSIPIGAVLKLPKGVPISLLGSFKHKEFIYDLYKALKEYNAEGKKPGTLRTAYVNRFKARGYNEATAGELASTIVESLGRTIKNLTAPNGNNEITADLKRTVAYLSLYSTCTDVQENKGHDSSINGNLNNQQEADLISFLATM